MLCLTQEIDSGLQIGPVWIHFRAKRGRSVKLAIDAPDQFQIHRNNATPRPAHAIYRALSKFDDGLTPELARMVRGFYAEPANFRFALAATNCPPDKLTTPEIGTLQILAQTVLRQIQAELPHEPTPTP